MHKINIGVRLIFLSVFMYFFVGVCPTSSGYKKELNDMSTVGRSVAIRVSLIFNNHLLIANCNLQYFINNWKQTGTYEKEWGR